MSHRAALPRPRKGKRHQVSRRCPRRVRQNLSFVNRPLSTPSASSSRRSSGPRPSCALRRRPTAGPGCCWWRTSSSGWHAIMSPMCVYPGSRHCPPNGAPLRECAAALRRCWCIWAAPSTCQNPADARAGVPKV